MGKSSGPLGFNNPAVQTKLQVELDVEKRLQADVLKDRIRIKEFFHDFDPLRKGYVAESAVRNNSYLTPFMNSLEHALEHCNLDSQRQKSNSLLANTALAKDLSVTPTSQEKSSQFLMQVLMSKEFSKTRNRLLFSQKRRKPLSLILSMTSGSTL